MFKIEENVKNEKEALKFIIVFLGKLQQEKFCGNVQINFRFGGVTNINKSESIKISS